MNKFNISDEEFKKVRPYQLDYLYKYRSLHSKYPEKVFLNNEIYFSDPSKFNDPFDCKPYLYSYQDKEKRRKYIINHLKQSNPNLSTKEIKSKIDNKKLKYFDNKDFLNKTFNNFLTSNGVFCLSEANDNILMWSHYSDCHRGYCLKFKASEKNTIFWEAIKIVYQNEYPQVNLMNIGNFNEFRKIFITKSLQWKYEKEWRLLRTEYEGGPDYYKYPPHLLTGVILGALMKNEDETNIINWARKHSTPVNIFKAFLNDKKYCLNILPFNSKAN